MDQIEGPWCLKINRAGQYVPVRKVFSTVSRLGNGIFWYAWMLALPLLFGKIGGTTSLQMLAVGVVGHFFYKFVKSSTSRPRPYASLDEVSDWTPALDAFSFPSGHTLHAVSFTIVMVAAIPVLAWILIPFTMMVAISRVILGLHYPSDVVIGALAGTLIAVGCLALWQ
ncbi:Phosphatase PAP2 family protein [Acanthopleuribacter pedis]